MIKLPLHTAPTDSHLAVNEKSDAPVPGSMLKRLPADVDAPVPGSMLKRVLEDVEAPVPGSMLKRLSGQPNA